MVREHGRRVVRQKKCRQCAKDWSNCPEHSKQALDRMQWQIGVAAVIVAAIALVAHL